jgi:hypothetical protein
MQASAQALNQITVQHCQVYLLQVMTTKAVPAAVRVKLRKAKQKVKST